MNTANNKNINNISIYEDPYLEIIDNFKLYLEKYKNNLYFLNTLPKDVLVEIIKKLIIQNKGLEKELEKTINTNINEEIKLINQENKKWYDALKQAYFDLINLQERGYIVYE